MRNITVSYSGIVDRTAKEPLEHISTGVTCLQGELEIEYKELVKLFGKPNAKTDGYKVDAEWVIFTPEGVATIYNYKSGKNYLGEEGLEVEEITDWHIGGHNEGVVRIIKHALKVEEGGEKNE